MWEVGEGLKDSEDTSILNKKENLHVHMLFFVNVANLFLIFKNSKDFDHLLVYITKIIKVKDARDLMDLHVALMIY